MRTPTIEVSDVTLKELTSLTQLKPVIVTHKNIPVYAVVPLNEADYESWALSENPDFMALIEQSRERYRREGEVPLDQVRQQLELVD